MATFEKSSTACREIPVADISRQAPYRRCNPCGLRIKEAKRNSQVAIMIGQVRPRLPHPARTFFPMWKKSASLTNRSPVTIVSTGAGTPVPSLVYTGNRLEKRACFLISADFYSNCPAITDSAVKDCRKLLAEFYLFFISTLFAPCRTSFTFHTMYPENSKL